MQTKFIACAAVLIVLFAAYSNHFHNAFHFDDSHTVADNNYIRNLANLPKFFTDARTFSSLPTNQSYRPLTTTTLAIDYHLAGGLQDTLWFHIDTFVWYVALLAAMFAMCVAIMRRAAAVAPEAGGDPFFAALFATALFGLHPVSAETVNYIVQRAEIHAALGAVAGLVWYIYGPSSRRWGGYLIPVAIGSLSKPTALVFPALLFVYVILFESNDAESWLARAVRAGMNCVPAGVAVVVIAAIQSVLTSKSYITGAVNRYGYFITQPIVTFHYVKQFFLPTELSADTDRGLVKGLFSENSVIGIAFLALFALLLYRSLKRSDMRPAAFGMLWFLIALLPTSLIPLAEVENDHRMFFPFIGLALAASWAAWVWIEHHPRVRPLVPIASAAILLAAAWGTHVRNDVWRTEESLWQDVSEKSPQNGRGLMNYGLTLMARGDFAGAIRLFDRAEIFVPQYAILKLNQGIAYGATGDDRNAESHFQTAMNLAPGDAQTYYYYARWLEQKGRQPEATALLTRAIELNPVYANPRYLLMQIYSEQGDAARLRTLAQQTVEAFPGDSIATDYLARGPRPAPAAAAPAVPRTPEDFLNLSLTYERAGKHQECIDAARQALTMRPNYAEAYNNIAAGYQSMQRWDEAIAAAEKALELKPDFQLARNNLQYSLSQKRLAEGGGIKKP